MKAVFENGAASESKVVSNKTYEDESLAAARAKRGVANKAVFEVRFLILTSLTN